MWESEKHLVLTQINFNLNNLFKTMTKIVSETDSEKCNICHNTPKETENRELILKIIEDKLKYEDLDRNEWRCSDTESEDGNVKCCSVCKKNFSSNMKKSNTIKEKYKPTDNSGNNYGAINPVVVINVFRDEDQEQIEKGGIINEAFLNEDETRFDLRIIPEVEEKVSDVSLKVEGETSFISNYSDKWRNSSKKSMSSVMSHNSIHMKTMTPSRRRSSAITSNSSEKRRESLRNMIFGDPELSLRRFSQDIRSTADKKEFIDEYETYKVVILQVFIPFLIAGKDLRDVLFLRSLLFLIN